MASLGCGSTAQLCPNTGRVFLAASAKPSTLRAAMGKLHLSQTQLKGRQTLVEVAQRSCGVSTPGVTQNLTGGVPRQVRLTLL